MPYLKQKSFNDIVVGEYVFYFSDMDRMKMCLTLLILFMMFIMLLMIKSTNVSDRLDDIVSVNEKTREDKFRLYRNILKKQIEPESESSKSKSLPFVKSNNISMDKISNVVETKNISSDKIFKVPLKERHHRSISPQAQNILDHQNIFLRRKRKTSIPSNKTAFGKREIQPWNNTTLVKKFTPTSFCSFSFDKKSLQEARTTLVDLQKQSVYLFYINLSTENALQSFTKEQRDNLMHWQYVLKEEKFLLNLPIDFDLITLNLLTGDNEEKLLSVKIIYNDTNCIENFDYAINSVRLLLWNGLFANDTSYFLCNKTFEGIAGRTILYVITTIWIGYDMNCKTAEIKDSYEEFKAEKDDLLIGPICCYFFSLQFVWIFVILDISYQNQYFKRQYEVDVDTDENYCLHFYSRNDRPYGLKQCVLKCLFKKCTINNFNNFNNSKTRLVMLILYFNFCVSLFRTTGRYWLSNYFNEDYLNVIRPNDCLIYWIFNRCSPLWVVLFDIVYAGIVPITFIFLGEKLYKSYQSRDSPCPNCLLTHKYKDILNENKGLDDAFIYPYFLLCATCRSCNDCSCKTALMTGLSFLICLCPIFPFNCNAYNACQCLSEKYQEMSTLCKFITVSVSFVLSYLLCLRPIISSFTFVFRSLTSFVFVALPIRAHIFRYTLLIVTIVVYCFRYMSEIINMNSEILNHIFEIEEKEKAEQTEVLTESKKAAPKSKFKVNYIREEMFDFIYYRLYFVKKRIYFAFFKMLIVLMLFGIVLETFIHNKTSITGTNFKDIMELIIIFIGPYAISLFLKANENNFLTNRNKDEIENSYKSYYKIKSTSFVSSSDSSDLEEDTKLCRTKLKTYRSLSHS